MGCAHCVLQFPKGFTGPLFGIARRYLPPGGHPLPAQIAAPYEYSAPERLMPPPLKDTAFVKYAGLQAIAQNLKHFLGQKGLPNICGPQKIRVREHEHPRLGPQLVKRTIEQLVGPNGEEAASAKSKWTLADMDHRTKAWHLSGNLARPTNLLGWSTHRYTTWCVYSHTHIKHNTHSLTQPHNTTQRIALINTHTFLFVLFPHAGIPARLIHNASAAWCKRWWKCCEKKVSPGTRVPANIDVATDAAKRRKIAHRNRYPLARPFHTY